MRLPRRKPDHSYASTNKNGVDAYIEVWFNEMILAIDSKDSIATLYISREGDKLVVFERAGKFDVR